jgi:hypothetical protein
LLLMVIVVDGVACGGGAGARGCFMETCFDDMPALHVEVS